jgi:hypothetical protein
MNGARLYTERAGSGPSVVHFHSGTIDSRMWDAQWQRFAANNRVVRYDLRGFGQSSIPPVDYAHHNELLAIFEGSPPRDRAFAGHGTPRALRSHRPRVHWSSVALPVLGPERANMRLLRTSAESWWNRIS